MSGLTTSQVMSLLMQRYAQPEGAYALFPEVPASTGGGTRRADALVMGCWSSVGYELQGFEVKVSRSDWLKEISDPAKAQAISRFCHRWWIVAGSDVIVRKEELPRTWGLMVPKGESQLRVVVRAPLLEATPVTPDFLASFLRTVKKDYVSQSELRAMRDQAEREKRELQGKLWDAQRQPGQRLNLDLERAAATFKESTGIDFTTFNIKEIAEAVRLCVAYQRGTYRLREAVSDLEWRIQHAENQFNDLASPFRNILAELRRKTEAIATDTQSIASGEAVLRVAEKKTEDSFLL